MKNSIAVWRKSKGSILSLDINIFISKEVSKNYIEFGIKIKEGIRGHKDFISIYLPYLFHKRDIIDNIQ